MEKSLQMKKSCSPSYDESDKSFRNKQTGNVFEKMKKKLDTEVVNVSKSSDCIKEVKFSSASPSKSKMSLPRRRSKTHEISDSGSESDHQDEIRKKKQKVSISFNLENKITSSPKSQHFSSVSKSLKINISEKHEISDCESESDHNEIRQNKERISMSSKVEHKLTSPSKSLHLNHVSKLPSLKTKSTERHEISDSDSDDSKKTIHLAGGHVARHTTVSPNKCNSSVKKMTSNCSTDRKIKPSDRHDLSNSDSDSGMMQSHHASVAKISKDSPQKCNKVVEKMKLNCSASRKLKPSERHDMSDSNSDDGEKNSEQANGGGISKDHKCVISVEMDASSNRLDKSSAGKIEDYKGLKRKADYSLTTEKTTILTVEDKTGHSRPESRPLCKYASDCYRKSPSHLKQFSHTGKRKSDASDGSAAKKVKMGSSMTRKNGSEIFNENQPFSFYLTSVTGIENEFNAFGAIHIKDILSPSMGNLVESCQFNFMFDIEWLMRQYPKEFRKLPLLIVHGEQRASLASLLADASSYPNITCCQAKLEMYGTHHSKMMFLLYEDGMRVVIHTANLYENDWYQKTQGVWISPLFTKLTTGVAGDVTDVVGDSATHFKKDLLEYLASYKSPKLRVWEKHIHSHDMSSAKVHIIGSVPGRHTSVKKNCFGHLKLRKVLQENGPDSSTVKNWPVIGQFSSIGSLGPTKDHWLCKEWLQSLSSARGISGPTAESNLLLVFPSVNNIRLSLEGYPAGGSVPYKFETAKKQLYLHKFFRQWKSDGRGRSSASPHIKTYIRPSPDFTEAAWFLVTSANLSKAAWGALEKTGSQLMIRSYEIGVLFLPKYFDKIKLTTDAEESVLSSQRLFPLPYDLPLSRYDNGDRPWMMDIPCVDLPDSHGNMWCPPV